LDTSGDAAVADVSFTSLTFFAGASAFVLVFCAPVFAVLAADAEAGEEAFTAGTDPVDFAAAAGLVSAVGPDAGAGLAVAVALPAVEALRETDFAGFAISFFGARLTGAAGGAATTATAGAAFARAVADFAGAAFGVTLGFGTGALVLAAFGAAGLPCAFFVSDDFAGAALPDAVLGLPPSLPTDFAMNEPSSAGGFEPPPLLGRACAAFSRVEAI